MTHRRFLSGILVLLLLCGTMSLLFAQDADTEAYDVKFYGLDVDVTGSSEDIKGSTTILLEVKQHSFDTLFLDLHGGLSVSRVLVDGEERSYTQDHSELIIRLESSRDPGSLLTTQVFYMGEPGEGFTRGWDINWDVPVTFTLSEPFYAKDWFACKEDLEDKADSVHVFITQSIIHFNSFFDNELK